MERPLETQVSLNLPIRSSYVPGFLPPAAQRPELYGVDLH